ncbi:MAG: helix-turn-helix domain-containing protein [Acidimicrobiales bacterium]|nr:helix-turn-helix domain-containing protein [Acidimicrobiales bacterium]
MTRDPDSTFARCDELARALDDLVPVLEANIARNREAIKRARTIQRLLRDGRSYTEIVRLRDDRLIVELLRENLEALYDAGARLRRLKAITLHEEGMTMSEIAHIFGVTRQRISALIKEARSGRLD